VRIQALIVMASLATAAHAQTGCNDRLASPVLTVPLPSSPFGVAVSGDDCWVFVSMMGDSGGNRGAIAVLSRKSGRLALVRTIPLPQPAAGIVLTHDGKLLIAAAIDKVVFVDVPCLISGCAKPVAGSFSDGEGMESIYANVTSDDTLLFVSEEAASAVTIIDLNRARGTGFGADSIIGKVPVGRAPIALTFSPDGRWLFTTSQLALKEWNWPAACKPEGRPNVSDLVNPEGAVIVINVERAKSDPSHAVAGRVPAGCSPVRMAISPSGERIYVTARNSNAVVAFDAGKLISDPDHSRLGISPVGAAPVPIAVVRDGNTVVAGNSNRFARAESAQSLTLLDAAKIRGNEDAAIGNVPAGAFPRELRVSTDGRTLYLTNFGSNSLQAMDVASLDPKRP
jgi:DNA-binding beta-propeller fold protein YncE